MISGTALLHHNKFSMASTKNRTEAMNDTIYNREDKIMQERRLESYATLLNISRNVLLLFIGCLEGSLGRWSQAQAY